MSELVCTGIDRNPDIEIRNRNLSVEETRDSVKNEVKTRRGSESEKRRSIVGIVDIGNKNRK